MNFYIKYIALASCVLPIIVLADDRGSDLTGQIHLPEIENSLILVFQGAVNPKAAKGTAFFVTPDGIVVTADHVITDDSGKVYPTLLGIRPKQPNSNVLHFEIVKRFSQDSIPRDIALLRIINKDTQNPFPFLTLSSKHATDEAFMGKDVIMAGFPVIFGEVHSIPLFRKGIISSTRFNIDNSPILILDLGSMGGFSGSPVISMENGEVLGVVKGSSKSEPYSDFSVAFPIASTDLNGIQTDE
ncbi:MAG TPA: serine protease [Candidatus Deferrimicrobium sp.]|nr:serine protease [Candidatus Deferrimicrobium sp.]